MNFISLNRPSVGHLRYLALLLRLRLTIPDASAFWNLQKSQSCQIHEHSVKPYTFSAQQYIADTVMEYFENFRVPEYSSTCAGNNRKKKRNSSIENDFITSRNKTTGNSPISIHSTILDLDIPANATTVTTTKFSTPNNHWLLRRYHYQMGVLTE